MRAHRRAVFAILSVGVILATLDQFIANVALPAIRHGLHGSVPALSWVLNSYSIVFTALLVPAGRIADRNGRKGVFLLGVALFSVASVACAAAGTLDQLIVARVAQAVGAALLVPSSLGVLLATYPAERRAQAVRTQTAVAGASAALGPVLGGLLVTAGWRWIFLVNVPIGLLALVAGLRVLPRLPAERGRLPDLLGAVILVSAIGALSLGIVEGPAWGWSSYRTLGALIACMALAAAFLRRSRSHPIPVVELPLLRVRRFAVATTGAIVYSAAFAAALLSLTLWIQTGWRWSALHFGLAFAPGALMVPLTSPLTGRVIRSIGPGATAALGSTLFAASAILRVVLIGPSPSGYLSTVLPIVLLSGVGVGLALPTLIGTGSTTLAPERFATGTGVLNMGRQLGFTIGVAVAVAILGARGGGQLTSFHAASLASAALALIAAVSSLPLGGRERSPAQVALAGHEPTAPILGEG